MAAAEWLLKKHCNPNPVDRFARTPLEVLPCKLLTPILCPYALLAWSHAATRAVIPLTNRFSPASLVASVAYPACLDEITEDLTSHSLHVLTCPPCCGQDALIGDHKEMQRLLLSKGGKFYKKGIGLVEYSGSAEPAR